MVIIAHGRLQHHFWGTYAASIVIQFHSADLASQALPQFAGWTVHSKEPKALVFHGGGDKLKQAEALLKSLGANMAKVSSIAKSIDFGEPFQVEVNLTPDDGPQPIQGGLFSEVSA